MKIKIFFLALLLPFFYAHGQTAPPKYHPLSIGDTIPNVELKHLINYPTATAHLADFRGKLLILDFWATWCSPCVAAFPKMNELRKTFGSKIAILPVTDQDEKTVNSLLTNMQKVKGLPGFSVIRDTVLNQLFKHTYIPHYAWINEDGIVMAITDGDEVTEKNIQKALRHELLNVKMKSDTSKNFDMEQPILAGVNAMDVDSVIDYHILTKHVNGYFTVLDSRYTPRLGVKITALNCSIPQLFSLAYSEFQPWLIDYKSRLVQVKDTLRLNGPDFYGKGPGQGKDSWGLWYDKNTYCYQLIMGYGQIDSNDKVENKAYLKLRHKAYLRMQQDLAIYFPEYTASIQKINKPALVMVRTGSTDLLTTKGGAMEKSDNKYSFHLKNAPWNILPLRLKTYYLQLSDRPLLDETGIKGNVDINITCNLSNVPELQKALKKYGTTGVAEWDYAYQTVFYTNVALDGLKDIKPNASDQTSYNTAKGMALFCRAEEFYNIAQLFAKPFDATTAITDLGIPLRLNADLNIKSVRSTVQQTYDQITNDLIQSISLLPLTTTSPVRPNKAAANGLLARVYLSMGNYKAALQSADNSLKIYSTLIDYNTLNSAASNPFTYLSNNEVTYYAYVPTNSALRISNAKIDANLYQSYSSNDLRKTIYFVSNPDGTIGFKGLYSGLPYLFSGITTDEQYLIRAECYARNGQTSEAMADLNSLLKTRFKTGTFIPYTASSADDALQQIITERRKELVMRGLRWTDLRRLNKDPRFAVTLSRTLNGVTYTLPPNDPRYVLPIPDYIIATTSIAQNQR